MAPRKPGLGKRWDDVNSRTARISEGLIPTTAPPTDYEPEDIYEDYVVIPRADRTRPQVEIPNNFSPIDADVYDAYTGIEWVTPDDDPSNYGQGPNRSTRVKAHKFVPYGALMNRAMGNQAATAAGIKFGTVFVRFQNNDNIYRYDHVPDHVYQSFRNSNSKGKFINDFLNNYPYSPAPSDANASDI
jgi:hypothetical protein